MFTSLFVTFLAAFGTPAAATNNNVHSPLVREDAPVAVLTVANDASEEAASNTDMSDTERAVRQYFSDIPALIEVARCESTFRHADADGNLIHGKVNKDDIGVMQINQYYHEESAQKLGYDIRTLYGNMAFGRYLYGKYGTEPWSASSKCWKPALAKAESKTDLNASAAQALTVNKK